MTIKHNPRYVKTIYSSNRHPELDSGSQNVRFRIKFGMTGLMLFYSNSVVCFTQ